MPILGEFEVAVRQEAAAAPDDPNQFKLNGEIFTMSGKDLTVAIGKYVRVAQSGRDSAEVEGWAAIIDMLTSVVIDEDAERLLRTVDGAEKEGLIGLIGKIINAETGRPTRQPSDSSDGLPTTGESSTASSSSEASSESLPPIQRDPRVLALRTIEQAGLEVLLAEQEAAAS